MTLRRFSLHLLSWVYRMVVRVVLPGVVGQHQSHACIYILYLGSSWWVVSLIAVGRSHMAACHAFVFLRRTRTKEQKNLSWFTSDVEWIVIMPQINVIGIESFVGWGPWVEIFRLTFITVCGFSSGTSCRLEWPYGVMRRAVICEALLNITLRAYIIFRLVMF